MIKIRDGAFENEKDTDVISACMFISACLTKDNYERIQKTWEAAGGYKACPWWEYIRDHAEITVDVE